MGDGFAWEEKVKAGCMGMTFQEMGARFFGCFLSIEKFWVHPLYMPFFPPLLFGRNRCVKFSGKIPPHLFGVGLFRPDRPESELSAG